MAASDRFPSLKARMSLPSHFLWERFWTSLALLPNISGLAWRNKWGNIASSSSYILVLPSPLAHLNVNRLRHPRARFAQPPREGFERRSGRLSFSLMDNVFSTALLDVAMTVAIARSSLFPSWVGSPPSSRPNVPALLLSTLEYPLVEVPAGGYFS